MNKNIAVFSLGRRGAGPLLGFILAENLSKYMDVLYIYSNQSEIADRTNVSGVKSFGIDTFESLWEMVVSLVKPFWIIKIIKQLKKQKIKIVIWPMPHPWTPILNIFMAGIGLRTITIMHDISPHKGEPAVLKIFNKAVIWTTHKIIVLSMFSLRKIKIAKLLKKTNYAKLGYLGIGDDTSAEVSRGKEILFFGRIEPYKNIEGLLDIFEEVSKSDMEIKLTIAGEGDISKFALRIGKNSNIKLINRWISNKEIPSLFKKASLVVLPYSEATQSGIIQIAYEFHTPVIAYDLGGMSEQIINGQTGYLISRNDKKEFAEKCLAIINHTELFNKLSNGIIKRQEDALWGKIIKKYLDVLNEE